MTTTNSESILGHYLGLIPPPRVDGLGYLFRGQADASWPLHSAAIRRILRFQPGIDDESLSELFDAYHRSVLLPEARSRSSSQQRTRELSDLEVLALLQHFKGATGLLDFSLSPLVALWFASAASPDDEDADGVVFVVDQSVAHAESTYHTEFAMSGIDDILRLLRAQNEMLAWTPPALLEAGPRILAQQSVFVLYPPQTVAHPSVPDRSLLKEQVTVAAEQKEQLRQELNMAGINEASLFPDFFGLAERHNSSAPLTFSIGQLRQVALGHYRNGKFAETIGVCSDLLERRPRDLEGRRLRAMARAAVGEHLAAVRDYDVAIEQATKQSGVCLSDIYFNRGNSKAVNQDYIGAIQDYTTALELNPNQQGAHLNRGNAHFASGTFQSALLDFCKSPEMPVASLNAGNAHMALGQLEKARDSYRRAHATGRVSEAAARNLDIATFLVGTVKEDPVEVALDDSRVILNIMIPQRAKGGADRTKLFPLAGNTGNRGNTGLPDLPGGEGYPGMTGMVIVLQYESASEDRANSAED